MGASPLQPEISTVILVFPVPPVDKRCMLEPVWLRQPESPDQSILQNNVHKLFEAVWAQGSPGAPIRTTSWTALRSLPANEVVAAKAAAPTQEERKQDLRSQIEHYTVELIKSIPLFYLQSRGAYGAAALLYGLDQVKVGDTTTHQLIDFSLGASKGAITKFSFDLIGAKPYLGVAEKAVSLGALSRAWEHGFTRQNYIAPDQTFSFQSGIGKTASAVINLPAIGDDILLFGTAHLLASGSRQLLKGVVDGNVFRKTVCMGTTFGISSGSLAEIERQRSENGSVTDWGLVLGKGLLQGGATGLASIGGAYHAHKLLAHPAANIASAPKAEPVDRESKPPLPSSSEVTNTVSTPLAPEKRKIRIIRRPQAERDRLLPVAKPDLIAENEQQFSIRLPLGESVSLKFATPEQLRTEPTSTLRQMVEDNRAGLEKVVAQGRSRIPFLAFHGCSQEFADRLTALVENRLPPDAELPAANGIRYDQRCCATFQQKAALDSRFLADLLKCTQQAAGYADPSHLTRTGVTYTKGPVFVFDVSNNAGPEGRQPVVFEAGKANRKGMFEMHNPGEGPHDSQYHGEINLLFIDGFGPKLHGRISRSLLQPFAVDALPVDAERRQLATEMGAQRSLLETFKLVNLFN